MGRLTLSNLIEAAIFLLIAGIFYAFSFEFNQPIEIYIFGAIGDTWKSLVPLSLWQRDTGNFGPIGGEGRL